ncbi:MAG: DHHA1 domain-containing protein [Acidilobaceae archaeon]
MNHLYIITHTDLDGIGSAASILRILGRKRSRDATILYAEPYNIHEILESLLGYFESGDLLVVADLGLNEENKARVFELLESIVDKGVRVEWYDHHVWDPNDITKIMGLGVSIYIDRATCATGVVVRYATRSRGLEPDKFLIELEDVVCSADLWRWSNPLSPKLFRAAGSREERVEWRGKVIDKIVDGKLWDEELEAKLEEYMNQELRNIAKIIDTVYVSEFNNYRIAVALKDEGPPSNSIIGALLIERYKAHIAGIIRPNGGLSLRSRTVNVQKIALRLGGGGHMKAAGAKIKIPIIISILSRINPKILTWYTTRKIRGVLGVVKDINLEATSGY